MVEITVNRYKRGSLMTINGRLDHQTLADLDAALNKEIDDGMRKLALDMSSVEYLSSAAIRSLVAAQKQVSNAGGSVCIAAPSDRVHEILDMAGLIGFFPMYPDTTAAVGSF